MSGELPPSLLGPKKGFPAGLPEVPPNIDPALAALLGRMRDRLAEFVDPGGNAALGQMAAGLGASGGVSGGTGGGGGGGGGTDDTPDLTPPPSVTGLTATAGLANIIVEFDAPAYTQGHGNLRTNIYAAKKDADDSTLPVFADAVLVDQASETNNIRALPSDLHVRWHIWAKYETHDGVLSPSPAGGLHGVVAQTGKIGNDDLGPLIVEASNLANGGDFSSIADNATFEAGFLGWVGETNWALVNDPANALLGNWCARHTAGGGPAALRNKIRVPVVNSDEFYAEAMVKAVGIGGGDNGIRVRLIGYNAAGVGVWEPVGNFVTSSTYTLSSLSATVPSGVAYVDVELEADHAAGICYGDNVRFQRKIRAWHLAANSIAVGTLAVQDGAIVNAMIGTAAIDDAKIANLSAAKLTVGDGTIGGNLKSAVFTSGSAGWIVRPDGSAEFAFTHIRGTLVAGQIAANFISTAMLQASSVTASKISVSNLAAISANMGTITAGTLTAGTVFAGALSAATGTFTGALSAASGTFDGTLTAAALKIAGTSLFNPAFASSSSTVHANGSWQSLGITTASIDPGSTGKVSIVVHIDWTDDLYSSGIGAGGGGDF